MPEKRTERPLCRNDLNPTRVQHAAILLFLLCGMGVFWYLFAANHLPPHQISDIIVPAPAPERPAPVEVAPAGESEQLIGPLKERPFWHADAQTEIPSLAIDRFPDGIERPSVNEKKRLFLQALLPAAITALNEVREERQRFLSLINRLPDEISARGLSSEDKGWQSYFEVADIRFLIGLTVKYRTTSVDKLAMRIDGLPPSLVLAQGAIESSWGTARFARQGNNIFGLLTWGTDGMIPEERSEGQQYKVATYDSILDSVRTYLLTINRHPAYQQLRERRFYTMDPYALAQGLTRYSERGLDYVDDVRQIIKCNNLCMYDRLAAASVTSPQIGKPFPDELTSI